MPAPTHRRKPFRFASGENQSEAGGENHLGEIVTTAP